MGDQRKSKKIKLEHLNNALHDNSIMGDSNNDTSNINIEEDSNNDASKIIIFNELMPNIDASKQMFRNFKMNADTNKYDCDTVNIFRNMYIDVKKCNKPELEKYSDEIKIIIIKDNEDDNYYKKHILKTIDLLMAIYVYFYNYSILLDIDYLKEYWKIEKARISKSIIAEESFYLIEKISYMCHTMELNYNINGASAVLVSNLAVSIQCDEVGGYNEILSKCMFFLFQSSCFIENGIIPKRFVNIISCFYNLTNITDKFQLEFDKEMHNKEDFINYPFDYIENESVVFLK